MNDAVSLIEKYAEIAGETDYPVIAIVADGDKVCHFYDGDDDKLLQAIVRVMENEPGLEQLFTQAILQRSLDRKG